MIRFILASAILAIGLPTNSASAVVADKQGDRIRIAAASDLKFALDQIKIEFSKTHPGTEIEAVYGSSGQFEQQIEKGAPFDLFLSADEAYPKTLNEKGLAESAPWQYGTGTLVLWTRAGSLINVHKGLSVLKDAKIKTIAIANPEHAPYGKAAKQAFDKANLLAAVQSKLVFGDSISQAAQFAQTGAADVGLIALALAKAPEMKGTFEIVKEATPLIQAGVVVKASKNKKTANEFADFVKSAKGQSILRDFGLEAGTAKEN